MGGDLCSPIEDCHGELGLARLAHVLFYVIEYRQRFTLLDVVLAFYDDVSVCLNMYRNMNVKQTKMDQCLLFVPLSVLPPR